MRGADLAGSPDEIVEKILFQHEIFGHDRLLLQLGVGSASHDRMTHASERLGMQVAPVVKTEIARRLKSATSRRFL